MDFSALANATQEIVTAIITLLLTAGCVLIGVIFFWQGLSKMLAHSRGERQGQSTAGPVAGHFFIGALMVQMGWTVRTISGTLFGGEPERPNVAVSYMPIAQENQALTQMMTAGVLWIYCIGFIAVIRGFVLWNALASGESRGQDNGWKGFWHIIFGAMAVNITPVVRMIFGAGS